MKAPATFAQVLARAVQRHDRESVVGLEGAVELLYRPNPKGRARQLARREIDEQTQGQPFRMETPTGPLFLEFPLWYFAGRSGATHCDCPDGRACTEPDRPVWPRTARTAARRLAIAA